MGLGLPARPEGTKHHRKLSTQRGTDMSFSFLVLTFSKLHEKHSLCCCASTLVSCGQIHLIMQACADAAVGAVGGDKYCLAVTGWGAVYPRMPFNLQIWIWGRHSWDSINQAHLLVTDERVERKISVGRGGVASLCFSNVLMWDSCGVRHWSGPPKGANINIQPAEVPMSCFVSTCPKPMFGWSSCLRFS